MTNEQQFIDSVNTTNQLIIYHGGCYDGFCAAWLLSKKFPSAWFMSAQYGDEPPSEHDVAGRDVYIVDFSYPRDVLERLHAAAGSLVVLDHHKTAERQLAGLPYCVFDNTKSGAMLTHEYIDRAIDGITSGIGTKPHWIVRYTQDRDLWTWQLPYSREISAWLRSHPMEFAVWDDFAEVDEHSACFAAFVAEGEAILRAEQKTVDSKVSQAHRVRVPMPDGFPGSWFPLWTVANATTLISETAGTLAKQTGVGCCWFELPSGERVYSLRASDTLPVDVSAMAKWFGGGGHRSAAGFRARVHPWNQSQWAVAPESSGQIGPT